MSHHNSNEKRLAMLERRKHVAARYLRGQTQWEIARSFEVSQATISGDLKAIQKEWLDQAVLDRGEWTARELARIDEVERQAWGAWTKSQEKAEILKARMRGDKGETEKVSKGQAGDPRFLDIVLKCVNKRSELLGLNKDADDDDEDEAADAADGVNNLIAQARAAVERYRSRSGGEAAGGTTETPPMEPDAGGSAGGGVSEPS